MIDYVRYVLPNGLRLIVHEDHATLMAAVSVQYDVGSRDESPDRTGFAHLFEHLMFGGSAHAPSYDDPLQLAGGENNAFTNADITNFYVSVPADNLATALWLEADRMAHLNVDPDVLDVQRRVVVEEFKETCLNEPYGDAWHHMSALAYRTHPYRWPTIGLTPEHLAEANLEDVRAFYARHYHAGNAIVAVAGAVRAEAVYRLVLKFFGALPAPVDSEAGRVLPAEPAQTEARELEVRGNAAVDSLYLTYAMPGRTDADFYVLDLLTDVLAEGPSSRLYRRLLKERELATTIDAYVTGTSDPGLVVIEAKPREGVSLEALRDAIAEQIAELQRELVPPLELEKVKNKLEASMAFSELSIVNKAINLCFYEGIDDLPLINREEEVYAAITAEELRRAAREYLVPARSCTVYYRAQTGEGERLPLPRAAEVGVE